MDFLIYQKNSKNSILTKKIVINTKVVITNEWYLNKKSNY